MQRATKTSSPEAHLCFKRCLICQCSTSGKRDFEREGGHSDPEIRGAVSNFFFGLSGSVWSKNKGGGGWGVGGAGPYPGSATTSNPLYRTNVREILKCFFFYDKAILDGSQRDLSQLGPHSAYGSA